MRSQNQQGIADKGRSIDEEVPVTCVTRSAHKAEYMLLVGIWIGSRQVPDQCSKGEVLNDP